MLQAESPVRQAGSFRDPSGFVFELDGRILRAVDESCLQTVRELRDSGLLTRLIDDGLVVPTTIVEDPELLQQLRRSIPSPPASFEHERIHPISYPYEWSPSMLADAGICTIDLQIRLLENGYSLKDATAYNIQFHRGRPVFIDIPSIERPPRLDVWIALGQFGRMFTNPLLLNRYKGQSLRSYFLADLDGSDVSRVQRAFGRLELLSPRLLLDVTLPYWFGRRASRLDDTQPRRTGNSPRVIQVEIGVIARQHVRIRQARTVVFCGVAGNRQCRIHRVAHRLRRKIRSAGIAALLADIDGDAQAFVAVIFDGLHLALAHRDGLAETHRNFGGGGCCAALFGIIQHVLGDVA